MHGRRVVHAIAVLIDRGGRELPIHADIVGKTVTIADTDRVDVHVSEIDQKDAVTIARKDAP